MKIYKAEQKLKERITSLGTVAKASVFVPVRISDDKSDLLIANLENINKESKCQEIESLIKKASVSINSGKHPDLLFGSAILVSTLMNLNDDVFLPAETWAAKNTPVNTPFNEMHVQSDIIGHIFACRVLDKENKVIATEEEMPSFFHLEVDFAIYKFIFPKLTEGIIKNFKEEEAFVSMECFFEDFDYALFDDDKSVKIVARNEKTAFLTEHLRCYGGTGKFNDMKIGRVIKQIRFIGMGHVNVPGNPSSKFTNLEDFKVSSAKNLQSVLYKDNEGCTYNTYYHIIKGKVMKIETLEQATEKITELVAEIERLSSELDEKNVNALRSELEEVKSGKEEVEKTVEQLQTKLSETEEKVKSFDEVQTQLDKVQKELEGIKTTEAAKERLIKLHDANIQIENEEEELERLKSMSDSEFDNVIKYAGLVKHDEPKADPNDSNTDTDADASDVSPVDKDAQNTNAANKQLDNVTPNDNADNADAVNALEQDDEVDEVQVVAKSLAQAIASHRSREAELVKK